MPNMDCFSFRLQKISSNNMKSKIQAIWIYELQGLTTSSCVHQCVALPTLPSHIHVCSLSTRLGVGLRARVSLASGALGERSLWRGVSHSWEWLHCRSHGQHDSEALGYSRVLCPHTGRKIWNTSSTSVWEAGTHRTLCMLLTTLITCILHYSV